MADSHPDGEGDIGEVIAALVAEVADLEVSAIQPDAALRDDLKVDSLAIVELVIAVEDRFGVRISDDEARRLVSVSDYAHHVQAARSG